LISPFTLGSSLQHALSDFYVVPRPDHPLLSSPPDILIGGAGKLTAVFLISKSTKRASLQARLIAARLALPPTTRMVAILPQDFPSPLNYVLENFDEVQPYSVNSQSLPRYCKGDSTPKADKKELQAVRAWHSASYSTAFQIAALRRKHEIKTTPADKVVEDLRTRYQLSDETFAIEYRASPIRIDKTNRSLVRVEKNKIRDYSKRYETTNTAEVRGSTVATLHSNQSRSNGLRAYWQKGLDSSFNLDTGVPYPNRFKQPSILLVDAWPTIKHDPEKPMRTAAFSGWIMASPSTTEDIEELITRSQSIIAKRRTENERT
jgi:hypothetical protein